MMCDQLLDEMDTKVVDNQTKYKIIEHLRPLQDQLTALNKTGIPNLPLIYEKGMCQIEASTEWKTKELTEDVITDSPDSNPVITGEQFRINL